MNEDVSRLPKWAQTRIEVLEKNVERWKKKATAGPADSDTFIYHPRDKSTLLGTSPYIRFCFGRQDYIDVYTQDGELRVRSRETLFIIPESSNSIKVRCEHGIFIPPDQQIKKRR